ncbi:MAG TPA: methyltransferase domain-containing protein [Planktothrix sp.]|jgi:ubiquinone/menaquinone biosynthesis C-methylase UbiE
MTAEELLSEAWDRESASWIKWARTPGHDSYWKFHRDQFLELVPPPGQLTVDIGCGEGRLSRDLKRIGHTIKSFDASATMIEAAREADPNGCYDIAYADRLPLSDGAADLAVMFMVLQDIDDLEATVQELSRVLANSARACLAIVHPLNSSGDFTSRDAKSEFMIKKSYLGEFRYSDTFERDGLSMTFHSVHRTVESFSRAFEKFGLCIEAIREHPVPDSACRSEESRRWQRVPLFLHFRLVKCRA